MNAHTAGPWSATFDTRHEEWIVTAYGGEVEICQDRGWGREYVAEDHANARLIAAAPDLLAALRGMLDQPEDAASYDARIQNAMTAIAKATQP